MRIVLAGGGTGGPVTPLLAFVESWRQHEPQTEWLWIGTTAGPEQLLVAPYGIQFKTISTGKLRRYWSIKNITDPVRVLAGWWQSRQILKQFRPDIVMAAGGLATVPVIWAAAGLRLPTIVHQSDIIPGLTNRLVQRAATVITVAFEQTAKLLSQNKAVEWIGNPVRPSVLAATPAVAKDRFGLTETLPVVLITGGGIGAEQINTMTWAALPELLERLYVIHITGVGKGTVIELPAHQAARYRQYELLTADMALAYAAADIVVSRAGLAAMTEVSALGKATILIPLAHSPQVANAEWFAKLNAARLLPQASAAGLTETIRRILDNPGDRSQLERNIKTAMKPGANEALVAIVARLTKQKK